VWNQKALGHCSVLTGTALFHLVTKACVWTTCPKWFPHSVMAKNWTRDLLSHRCKILSITARGQMICKVPTINYTLILCCLNTVMSMSVCLLSACITWKSYGWTRQMFVIWLGPPLIHCSTLLTGSSGFVDGIIFHTMGPLTRIARCYIHQVAVLVERQTTTVFRRFHQNVERGTVCYLRFPCLIAAVCTLL